MFIVDARRAMSSLAKSNANGGGNSKTRPVTFVARWRFSSHSGTPVFDVAGASKTWKTARKFSPGFISEGMWDVAGEVQVDSFENLILTYERKYLRGTRLEIRTRHTSNSWVSTGRVSPCPNLNTQIFLSYLILEHTSSSADSTSSFPSHTSHSCQTEVVRDERPYKNTWAQGNEERRQKTTYESHVNCICRF